MTRPWVWIDPDVLHAVHDEQLAEHGGLTGLRDAELFSSAMARPQHLATYAQPDAAHLAAAYGVGIARNHPYLDGNKRTAFVAVELLLILNGFELEAEDADCVTTMLGVAAGEIAEDTFAAWIRAQVMPLR